MSFECAYIIHTYVHPWWVLDVCVSKMWMSLWMSVWMSVNVSVDESVDVSVWK